MVLADEDRRIVDVNGACLQLLGHPRVDVVGRPIWEFVAGGPVMKPREWAAALARRRFTGEAEMLRADGSTVHVQWGATTEVITGRSLVVVAALSVSARARGIRERPLSPRPEMPRSRPGSARSSGWSRWGGQGLRLRMSFRSPTTPCVRTCEMG